MNEKEILNIIKKSSSKYDALLKIYGYTNKNTYKKLNDFINNNNVNINHYKKKPKFCKECKKLITISKNIFCNRSCSAKYNNKNRKLSDKTKNKISKSLISYASKKSGGINSNKYNSICVVCNKIFTQKRFKNRKISSRKTCSSKCLNKLRVENSKKSVNLRIQMGLHTGWKTRNIISYPEKFFIDVLNNNNIDYIHNHPVKKRDLGLDDDSNYFLDFYIKNKNIDLEIDGKQHKYRKKHDAVRDDALEKNGYNVYRIEWKNINNDKGKKHIKKEIENFLFFYKNIN